MRKSSPHSASSVPPALALAASLALASGATAQTEIPPIDTDALGVAMAQARQSPFHSPGASGDRGVLGAPLPRVPHAGGPQVPAPAEGPSFHRVFWPTLGSSLGSWALAFVQTYNNVCLLHGREGRCPESESRTEPVMIVGYLVLIPPAVASLAGASFYKALLGSLAGFAGGVGVGALGLEPLTPVVHAALTTVLGRL
ncbi:MAG: hypothetical protein OXQ94_02505 [Gemmatimonadota bacterium]|nr:hypothetical protein [Gemmatimonadota bacterium]MDE2870551.1 hypothetical protein [Gemmatimonadota bacterium]